MSATKTKTTNESESDIDEITAIVKAVKRHLQEDNCMHGLRFIISEAYQNQNQGRNNDNKANSNRRRRQSGYQDE